LRFRPTPLSGAFLVDLEPHHDERGFFARSYCAREFAEHGLARVGIQCNVSWNQRRGTLRGLHYNAPPDEEAKLVRCTAGAILDVIVDLRRDSPTHLEWFSVELDPQNRRMLYVPAGFAHGFLTLRDDSEVFYQMSAPYVADAARGVRWNDPSLGITWPAEPAVISERDASYPDYDPDAVDR
jgi:dTDP-4-dehydrorhamnose 3,5-epimerase